MFEQAFKNIDDVLWKEGKRFVISVILELDVPGEQLIDALSRVSSNAGDEGAQIRLGVDVVELGGFDDGVHDVSVRS